MEIVNDSAAHAGHAAMKVQGSYTGETHFTVNVISKAFEGKARSLAYVRKIPIDAINPPTATNATASDDL